MKKGTFLILAMMAVATINATGIDTSTSKIGVNYRYNDAITFIERGVEFHVFLNGDFDFNTHFNEPTYVDYYGRRTKFNRGIRIERDYNGRIRRVGNTFINYNVRGNVKRIGNVFMRYRFGQLTKIGHMKIRYDRYGNPSFYGDVKYDDYYFNNGESFSNSVIYNYNDTYFYRREFRRNYRKFKEDNNFYYYRALPNAKIGKRHKILKRKKVKRGHLIDKHKNNKRKISVRKKIKGESKRKN